MTDTAAVSPGERSSTGERSHAEHIDTVLGDAFEASVARFADHLPHIADDESPEHVHQARVGLRRTRTLLRAFRSVLDPDWHDVMRKDARVLGKGLGPLRDADVMYGRLDHAIATLAGPDRMVAGGILERAGRERADARRSVVARLGRNDHTRRIEAMTAGARAPQLAVADPREVATLVRIASKTFDKLRTAVGRLGPQQTSAELHRVRILTKSSRYVADAVEVASSEEAKTFVEGAAALQRILGEMHDASVSVAWLRKSIDDGSRKGAFAAGRLAQIEAEAVRESIAAWPAAWTRLSEPASVAWLEQ